MTATDLAPGWWRTAPNPACSPFCTDEHDGGEFSRWGALLCAQKTLVLSEPNEVVVEVSQYRGLNPDETPRTDPANVWINTPGDDFHEVDAAKAIAAAVAEAARIAEETNR